MQMVIALLSMLASSPTASQNVDPVLPEWMAGCWRQQVGAEWTEECWMAPRGGIMLGAARTGNGDQLREWEALQIMLERPSADRSAANMALWAAPGGADRTRFVWRPDDLPGLTFVNLANDFPQRIRYWRDGDVLIAEIAMADGERSKQWRYNRQ